MSQDSRLLIKPINQFNADELIDVAHDILTDKVTREFNPHFPGSKSYTISLVKMWVCQTYPVRPSIVLLDDKVIGFNAIYQDSRTLGYPAFFISRFLAPKSRGLGIGCKLALINSIDLMKMGYPAHSITSAKNISSIKSLCNAGYRLFKSDVSQYDYRWECYIKEVESNTQRDSS